LPEAVLEKILKSISQLSDHSFDLDSVLNATVVELRHFLGTERVVICRFDLVWNSLIIAESVSSDEFSIVGRVIYDPCFELYWQKYFQQRRVNVIEDIEKANIQACHQSLLKSLKIRANLVLPIMCGESLWGLLAVHQCSGPRSWKAQEISLLQHVMVLINLAVHQAQLQQEMQQLNQNLERQLQERTKRLRRSLEFELLLKQIVDKVRHSLDEDQIFQTVTKELVLGLRLVCCRVGLYNADKTSCTISHEYTTTRFFYQGRTFQIIETSAFDIHQQLFQGITSQFCLLTDGLFQGQSTFTSLACPLMSQTEEVFGNLWLFKPKVQVFNEWEVRLVQQVTTQCAIAIQQARLYQAAQGQTSNLEQL